MAVYPEEIVFFLHFPFYFRVSFSLRWGGSPCAGAQFTLDSLLWRTCGLIAVHVEFLLSLSLLPTPSDL